MFEREAKRKRITVRELVVGSASAGGAMPISRLGELAVYAEPPILCAPVGPHETLDHVITAGTQAEVQSAGGIAATRGRNLSHKAWGTALTTVAGLGPLGALLYGNARETIHDGRELYQLVADPAWHYAIAVHPDMGGAAREFSLAINRVAAGMSAQVAASAGAGDKVARLSQLAELRASGAITEEEFAQLKAELLGG